MTGSANVWQEVRDLITDRRTGALADRVIALSGAERAEVGRRLPEFLKEMRTTATQMAREDLLGEDESEWSDWELAELQTEVRWEVGDAIAEFRAPLLIAGAGTISGPAAAVAWLSRREFNPRWSPTPDLTDLLRVLAARPADWQTDVAVRLAERIRTTGDPIVPLALALLRACGCEPPKHEPLVVAWLSATVVDDDPLFGPMFPRLFEAEGAGRALREERLTPRPTPWLSLLRRLLAAGRVSREELLDGCVSRFLRGGDAIDLRFFVRLHELVDPTPQEAAARARDYLRLLPAAPGTVAELALAQARRTGPHDPADVVEAIGALTFRAEAKPARAGLKWLDEEVRRSPACADELAPALATAFGHVSYEVQGRAARLALKHAAAFDTGRALIAEAVPMLPAALGAKVAARFGGESSNTYSRSASPGMSARSGWCPYCERSRPGTTSSTSCCRSRRSGAGRTTAVVWAGGRRSCRHTARSSPSTTCPTCSTSGTIRGSIRIIWRPWPRRTARSGTRPRSSWPTSWPSGMRRRCRCCCGWPPGAICPPRRSAASSRC
ncbi:DUF6493 family protein [Sphaerimonospora thailandensis]|uniref:HEAT repeat protein n=1 Tax=Sphaerimonospora thailandensis TaxID=795644 RepID=A0A8J3RD12_9ACTN|nr:DUF6493 family protein [Sphaerimonospora thailandensis]GIH72494.1 hypothetical protein Mth01_47470 [Sphaerimonospora thailandensis]